MEESLKRARLRSTRGRRRILELLNEAESPLTAEELHSRIGEQGLSLSTVYRNLAALAGRGLLIKTVGQDGIATYQPNTSAHRHRIVCVLCGRETEISACPLESLSRRIGEETGFEVTGHSLEFTGVCPQCRQIQPNQKEKT